MPSAQRSRTVLVVDDDLVIRRVLALLLERRGLRVIAVGDGAAAIRALDSTTPSLVCVDIELPDMSGFELLATIRSCLGDEMPPAAVLTSSIDPEDERRAQALGVASFLMKPVGSADVDRVLVPLAG